jgi:hypothetical protein
MSERDDGGPAFPSIEMGVPGQPPNVRQRISGGGMSMRDYFAAKAMEAFTGNMVMNDRITPKRLQATLLLESLPDIAELSFAMADAMLRARKA